jgi:hypothetical protein
MTGGALSGRGLGQPIDHEWPYLTGLHSEFEAKVLVEELGAA